MLNEINFKAQGAYGSIDKIGTSPDGRVIYQVVDPDGKVAGGLSVAPNDCDKFEHSYKSIMEAAPKVESYMKTHTQEDVKSLQKKGRWITGISACIGGLIPAIFIHKPDNWFIQFLFTLAGTIAGGFGGLQIAKKVSVPPGAEEMSKASKEISKLDIKPI